MVVFVVGSNNVAMCVVMVLIDGDNGGMLTKGVLLVAAFLFIAALLGSS